jgi:glycosyltransferase involved in cell wall biosynthesis
MPHPQQALPIALDYRPALLSQAGIGRATRELARALAARTDLDVHLFGHSLAAARVPGPPPPGAVLHRVPVPGRSLPWLHRLGLGADRLCGSPRVFHWTDFVHPPLSRAHAVLTVHDLAFVRDGDWHGRAAAGLAARTRNAIDRASAIVVPSRATADDVRAFAPEAPPVHVVPFGAEHALEHASAPAPLVDRDYVLCLGTIEPRKNHLGLLRALERLGPRAPFVVIVGRRGWRCDAIVDAIHEAERRGQVQWERSADDATVWRWLTHARALVYASLWEGFGFPPLEAMALGVPVVAHDAAPMQQLGDGALLLARADDADAFADALARVFYDGELCRGLVAAGRRRAAAFRWSDCAARHAAIYLEVSA